MENKGVKGQTPEEEVIFSLQDFLTKCLSKWKWFVVSVIIFCGLGAWYALSKQYVYSRSMQVLIKDQDGGGGVGDIASSFSSLGLFSSNTNVNNELISLTSPAVMYEVIEKLGLDVNYNAPGRFHLNTLYGTNLPYLVTFKDLEEQQGAGFTLHIGGKGSVTLDKFYLYTPDGRVDFDKTITITPGQGDIKTPIGYVTVEPNPIYEAPKSKKARKVTEILVSRDGMQSSVELYSAKVKGDLADKDADVIELTMKDESIERAVDVLNSIVAVYNDNWIQDKNKIAIATSNFIDERLKSISQELGVVDSDISKFKSEHRVPDLEEAAKSQMKEAAEMRSKELEVTNQMSMAVYLRDYLNNPANANNVIPVNTGISSPTLEAQIGTYNNLLLNRNNLEANSSENNPIVKEYDTQLKGLRSAIVNAIDGQLAAFNKTLSNMKGAQGTVESQLASGPTQAMYLLSIERDQKVKQELYLYLLQKKEENELTQKFTADNTRVITPPMGSLNPVAPKKKMIVAVAFLFGLIVPGVIVYIQSVSDNKVRSRKDLEGMSVPFAGEIPQVGKKSFRERFAKFIPGKKKGAEQMESVVSVVKAGSRDGISESFRIMRGNLDLMNQNKGESSVIVITSFNPGSGKSFISYNLAATFALKGKRVLLVDGDLRHGSTSQFVNMPSKGLTNFLTGNAPDWKQFAVPVRDHDNMYIMPIGHRPPNPAELLEGEKMAEFIKEAREDYDYILIDCPPTDVVVDTRLIEQYADRTLFVVRAGLLEKSQIAEIDNIYSSKVFKQMSIVLNGTTGQSKSYGTYGYYGGE
ncbi:MAG: polysaccharide biosynthesis tyrosine autokinase [Bacteroidales bacterium]|nr:polysaccharide biosynthesis tyrosine autokinase [Bacteroidales bacterium]